MNAKNELSVKKSAYKYKFRLKKWWFLSSDSTKFSISDAVTWTAKLETLQI